jgi:hypothetical protein
MPGRIQPSVPLIGIPSTLETLSYFSLGEFRNLTAIEMAKRGRIHMAAEDMVEPSELDLDRARSPIDVWSALWIPQTN